MSTALHLQLALSHTNACCILQLLCHAGTDLSPILPVLAKVFDQALEGGGAKNINFQDLAADLAQITFDYPFRCSSHCFTALMSSNSFAVGTGQGSSPGCRGQGLQGHQLPGPGRRPGPDHLRLPLQAVPQILPCAWCQSRGAV